ncbi:MAG: ATP-binding cassette domain-containing protein, partial [Chloroflexi bacterium]|nr:ATP-binding cassette domain-containing protein [Chloroflexota bacterium]
MTTTRRNAPAGAPVLACRDLAVVRGRREVLRLDALEVAAGATVAVLGPNGAGKSTLLLAGALLLPAGRGEVALFGERPRGAADAVRLRRGTATVFQEPGLLDMTAQRNVETALALHGVPRGERGPRALEWLGRLGVRHLAGARPHTLSGGEAQRVSLARAFAVRPRLLFLDEPFSALDPGSHAPLVGELHALLASEGTAALLATHDLSEARLLADRALVLLDGHPAQLGPTREVFDRPAGRAVASFLGYSTVDA